MVSIMDVEGIGEKYADKFKAMGIHTTDNLLEQGGTSKGRKEIAEKTGISEKEILKWVNHVDLYRIKGVGSEYADLLEAAGVDTVVELGNRNPVNLFKMLNETNTTKKLVRKMPTADQVTEWVEQARTLDRKVSY